jgi:hypothetical protein
MGKLFAGILVLLSAAHAQTAYVQQFYAADLQLVPGRITLSTGDPVVIEFYGQVNTVIAGQPNPLTIDQLDTAIVLITAQRSGTVPLTVEVDGAFLLFEAQIDNADQRARVYRVAEQHERSYAPSSAILPTPEPETPAALPEAGESDPGGSLTLIPGEGTIFFSYTNTTPNRIALDPGRISVTKDGTSVPFEVVKTPLRNLVSPGERQSGIIRPATGGRLDVRWQVVSLSERGGVTLTVGGSADVD